MNDIINKAEAQLNNFKEGCGVDIDAIIAVIELAKSLQETINMCEKGWVKLKEINQHEN